MQWDDFNYWLPDNLLLGLDKVTMAHSLEARSPFLDHNLALWVMSLPTKLKWHKNQNKYLLRQFAGNYLSKKIVNRPKKGFDLPLLPWINEQLPDVERSLMRSALIEENPFINMQYIQQLLLEVHSGKARSAQPLWNIIVLKLWYDVFVKCDKKEDIRTLQSLSRSF